MTVKVVFFTNLAPEIAAEIIAPAPPSFHVEVHPHDLPPAQKAALAADADFLILFPSAIEPEVLRAATRLKLVQLVSAGFDKMPLDVLTELGIP
ncbi:MAG: hydroxyacid dehydrogenase, partial [Caldilineae bacterium]